MAAVPPVVLPPPVVVNPIDAVLTTCGFNPQQRQRLINIQGLADFAAVARLKDDKEVTAFADRVGRLREQDGKIVFGMMQLKNLQALVWWTREQRKLGVDLAQLDPALFTAGVIEEAETAKEVQVNATSSDVSITDLPKFHPHDFDECERALRNLLAGKIGVRHETLDYVIRAETAPTTFADDAERRKYQILLTGPEYDNDNRQVFTILDTYLSAHKSAGTWIAAYRSTQNGRAAYLAWTAHYDGEGEYTKRVMLAKQIIADKYYKGEKTYSFESYVSDLNKAFLTLSKSEQYAYTDTQKVERMLNKVLSDNVRVVYAVETCKTQFRDDWVGATDFMSARISDAFRGTIADQHETRAAKRRRISQLNRQGGRGGRGRGRGRGGGRGGGRGNGGGRGGGRHNQRNNTTFGGVNCSDPTRTFSRQEWQRMGPEGQRYVRAERHFRNGGRGQPGGRGDGQRNQHVQALERRIQALESNNSGDQGQQQQDPNPRGGNNGMNFGMGINGGGRGGRGGRG